MMKKYLLLFLGILLFAGLMIGFQKPVDLPKAQAADTTQYQTTFDDVPINHWAYWYIEAAKQAGVTLGVSTDPPMFGPDMTVTRLQFAAYLVRAANKEAWMNTNCQYWSATFYDVPKDYPLFCNLEAAYRLGLLDYINYPLPETGQACYYYKLPAFCPNNNTSQYFALQSIRRYTGNGVSPSGYTPAYSSASSSQISKAQLMALIAWNFNPTLTATFSGTVTDSGTTTGMIPQAHAATGIPGITVAIAGTSYSTTTDSSGIFKVNVISAALQTVYSKIGSQYTANFSGGGVQSFSKTFNLNSAKISGSYQTPKDMVHLSGQIGNCQADYAKAYDSASIIVYTTDVNNPLATSTAHYDSSSRKSTYAISFPKISISQYKILATKSGYISVPQSFPPPATGESLDGVLDLQLRSLDVTFRGRITDSKNAGKAINNARVQITSWNSTDSTIYYSITDNGYYKIIQDKTLHDLASVDIASPPQSGYQDKLEIEDFDLNSCPTISRDYKLDKAPECNWYSDTTGSDKVKFCWYGQEAIKYYHDPSFQQTWQSWANKIFSLRSRAGVRTPSRVDIISGARGGWANISPENQFFGQIQIGTDILKLAPIPSLSYLSHEFGHLVLYFNRNSGSAEKPFGVLWEDLFDRGQKINKWDVVDEKPYFGAGGHPWDDEHELFASSFAIMDGAQLQFKNAINNQTNSTLKSWLKDIYNTQAPNLGITDRISKALNFALTQTKLHGILN